MKCQVWAFLFISSFAACKSVQKSSLKHDMEDPIGSDSKYFWTTQDDQEYVANTLTPSLESGAENVTVYEKSHPLVKRLQHWADTLDAMLRDRYPDVFDHIPHPRIMLVQADTENAFVAGAPIVFSNVFYENIPINYKELIEKKSFREVAFDESGVGLGDIKARMQKATYAQLLAYVNNLNGYSQKCKMILSKSQGDNFLLKAGNGCEMEPSMLEASGPDKVKLFLINPRSPNVTIFTGLVKNNAEESVIGILYHELGHYYKAHGLVLRRSLNYFFNLSEQNSSSAPTVSPEDRSISEAIELKNRQSKEATDSFNTVSDKVSIALPFVYKTMAGQSAHGSFLSGISGAVSSAVTEYCPKDAEGTEKCKICLNADSLAGSQHSFLQEFPYGFTAKESEANTMNYLRFEKAALACLDQIKIVDPAAVSAGSWTLSTTEAFNRLESSNSLYIDMPEVPFMGGTFGDYIKTATKLVDGLAEREFNEAKAKNFFDNQSQLVSLNKQILALHDSLQSIYDQAKEKGLGYYSFEEEADDLAGEWMNLVGLDSRAIGTSFINGLQGQEKDICEKQRANGWKDENGNAIIKPWGPLNDAHPDTCYRARNADMEILAHAYKNKANSLISQMKPDWESLVSLIAQTPAPTAQIHSGSNPMLNTNQKARVRSLKPRSQIVPCFHALRKNGLGILKVKD